MLRPLSDLFLWAWRLERRTEFLYRPQFDKWLRPPLFSFAQALQNSRRRDEHLQLAEERLLPDEEQLTREIIDELNLIPESRRAASSPPPELPAFQVLACCPERSAGCP